MSKSKGTSVTPDEVAQRYGADTLRLYILFEAPFEDTIQWSEERLNGTFRFLNRLWTTVLGIVATEGEPDPSLDGEARKLRRVHHQTIAKVSEAIDNLRFNTAVSGLMILLDHMRKFVSAGGAAHPAAREAADGLVRLLAPMAPHIADELHARLGGSAPLYRGPWPIADPELAAEDEVEVVVQVNGKLRDRLAMPAGSDAATMEAAALALAKIAAEITGKTVRKVVVVPGRLVNIVAN
ncbi:MAG: class I tRNA ligase family protein, partial [Armatimonadota bacterium]